MENLLKKANQMRRNLTAMGRVFKTDFLVPQSRFTVGMGSVLNIGGNYFDYSYSPNPDEDAMGMDWRMVGEDIRSALAMAAQGKCPMR